MANGSEKILIDIQVNKQQLVDLNLQLKDAKKQLKQTTDEINDLEKSYKKGDVTAESYAQTTRQLTEKQIQQQQQVSKLSNEYRDLTRSQQINEKITDSQEDSYERLAAQLSQNRRILRTFPADFNKLTDEQKNFIKSTNEINEKLKQFDANVGFYGRNVGNYANSISTALQGLGVGQKTAEKVGGGIGAISNRLAMFGGVAAGVSIVTGSFIALNKQMQENAKIATRLRQNFGDLGQDLGKSVTKVRQIAEVYGQDVNQVITAATNLSKGFGISATQSLAIIQKGFESGANNSDEFLDTLREYPTVFKETGVTAQDFLAIQLKSVKEGIYSDKAIDSLKESIISLREFTPATQAAINNLGKLSGAGADFGDTLRNDITNGTITLFDAVKKVSVELGKVPSSSKEAGAVLADVFRGAGEDAGVFTKMLATIDNNLLNVKDSADTLVKANARLQNAWIELTTSLTSGDGSLSKALIKVLDAITNVVETINKFNTTDATTQVKMLGNALKDYLIDSFTVLFGWATKLPTISDYIDKLKNALSFDTTDQSDRISKIVEGYELMTEDQLLTKITKLRIEQKKLIDEQNRMFDALKDAPDYSGEKTREQLKIVNEQVYENNEALQILTGAYNNFNSTTDNTIETTNKLTEALDNQLISIEYVNKALEEGISLQNSETMQAQKRIDLMVEQNKKEINDIVEKNTQKIDAEKQAAEQIDKNESYYHDRKQERLQKAQETEKNNSDEYVAQQSKKEKQLDAFAEFSSQAFDFIAAAQEAAKKKELKEAGDNAAKIEEINRKYLKKEKQRAAAEIIVNSIIAAIKAAGRGDYLSLALIGTGTAFGLGKLALYDEYGDGGLIGGKPHAQGGTMVNAERGEAIINKRSTAMYGGLLSDINVAGGGRRFENGGVVGDLKTFQSTFNRVRIEKQPVLVVRDLDDLRSDMAFELALQRN